MYLASLVKNKLELKALFQTDLSMMPLFQLQVFWQLTKVALAVSNFTAPQISHRQYSMSPTLPDNILMDRSISFCLLLPMVSLLTCLKQKR